MVWKFLVLHGENALGQSNWRINKSAMPQEQLG